VHRVQNAPAFSRLNLLDAVGYVLLSELGDWDTFKVMSGRSTLFFYNLWCLAVNVFLTCDASRGLWHHPVTNDVPSVEDFNKNEKLLAVYSLEDASSLWFFIVKMRVGLGGEDDFAYDATVAPSVMTPVGYKSASHVTTFLYFCWKRTFPWTKILQ